MNDIGKKLSSASPGQTSRPACESSSSLDFDWMDWREWAEGLIGTHSSADAADTIADMGLQMNDLRKGMASEATIIAAQTFDVKALGKGRREILTQQVRRMYGVALAQCPPRTFITYGPQRKWRQRVQEYLEELR